MQIIYLENHQCREKPPPRFFEFRINKIRKFCIQFYPSGYEDPFCEIQIYYSQILYFRQPFIAQFIDLNKLEKTYLNIILEYFYPNSLHNSFLNTE